MVENSEPPDRKNRKCIILLAEPASGSRQEVVEARESARRSLERSLINEDISVKVWGDGWAGKAAPPVEADDENAIYIRIVDADAASLYLQEPGGLIRTIGRKLALAGSAPIPQIVVWSWEQ